MTRVGDLLIGLAVVALLVLLMGETPGGAPAVWPGAW